MQIVNKHILTILLASDREEGLAILLLTSVGEERGTLLWVECVPGGGCYEGEKWREAKELPLL